ncbi:MAG: uncharacterized protein A8A55_2751 [Amphiamblys sp. WSBS2006]|nr:MAG: uncharacterized protein A8A55_2751 [Amphiamblys sp. WSBS2006]
MSVKICDFGFCFDGEEERLFFPGTSRSGYYRDILSVAGLMVRLYLGETFSERVSLGMFTKADELEMFLKVKREGGILPGSELEMLCSGVEGVVSEDGLDLFLNLLSPKNEGCTTAAEALGHPFFDEGHGLYPPIREPKQR